MKSKRAEEFINGHIKIGNLQFTAADIEYCVMLAEQEAEEKIEALKARAVEAYCEQCGWHEADGNCSINEDKCPKGCEYANQFIREVNDL